MYSAAQMHVYLFFTASYWISFRFYIFDELYVWPNFFFVLNFAVMKWYISLFQ